MSISALPGEEEVVGRVNEHRDWRVHSTDHKKDAAGMRVIFYLESKFSRKFEDSDGTVRVAKPIYIADFAAGRVKREPDMVARQLVNTANTKLSENMRSLEGK